MEILRSIVVLVHLVGFAVLFGAWVVEAFRGTREMTKAMHWGLVIALVAGLALAAPWGLDGDPNYMKIGIKLVVVVVIGALLGIGGARQRRTGSAPAALFWLVGLLTLGNAALAVIW
ncbi:Fe-S protein [Microbacterium sp. gxy059]|uniref:Fe-S protein n=1 Tax=Microbacterium sp. gxy059 TaxID=2957199 RepID=UPI003D9774FC